MALSKPSVPIQSTAGAVPIKNVKGDLTMQKVKVQRYVTGKRPDFAPQDSSDEEEDFDFVHGPKKATSMPALKTDTEKADRRLRRLQERHMDDEDDDDEDTREARLARRRHLHEPEMLGRSSDEEMEEDVRKEELEESSEEEELDEEEIERRRTMLRSKVRQQKEEEELMDKEEDKEEEGSEEESSEYEEYTDSEEEETGPRLKPVFVRRKDRVTIQEKESQEIRTRELETEARQMAEERRRYTIKMIEDEARKETADKNSAEPKLGDIDTDDDNDEEEYETWKVRELKRIKRDREEREAVERERQELDRIHNMTEEERRLELKNNPHVVDNRATKGKYKYLQKYYHRGAFFMDNEEDIYKRDFSAPTLEDHFNKTTLPKVMQVKNFGRSGRTRYTHLVDQDTTQFESPWADAALSHKFHTQKGAGMKQTFDRPAVQKRK